MFGKRQIGVLHIEEALKSAFAEIEELHANKRDITGMRRIPKLDSMTSGLQRSDLIIIAGRPGMKTALL